VVRIDVGDTDPAKDLIRVLVTRIGAEPVSLDRHTGDVCVDCAETDEALSEVLDVIDECLDGSAVAIVRIGRTSDETRSFRVGETRRARA
jgi:hypothetical protein